MSATNTRYLLLVRQCLQFSIVGKDADVDFVSHSSDSIQLATESTDGLDKMAMAAGGTPYIEQLSVKVEAAEYLSRARARPHGSVLPTHSPSGGSVSARFHPHSQRHARRATRPPGPDLRRSSA